jgi:hypothetical protein
MEFLRPKPSDFEPNEKARRAREAADADRMAPRNFINGLRGRGFGARFSIDRPHTGHLSRTTLFGDPAG